LFFPFCGAYGIAWDSKTRTTENALKLLTAQFAISKAHGKHNIVVTTLDVSQHDKHKMAISQTFNYKCFSLPLILSAL
jgi:hypothetical protein